MEEQEEEGGGGVTAIVVGVVVAHPLVITQLRKHKEKVESHGHVITINP